MEQTVNISTSEVHTSLDGRELRGIIHHDGVVPRLQFEGEPTVSVSVLGDADPAACLRDLARISSAIADHRDLLDRVAAEDRRELDAVLAERDRLYDQVDAFVPPPNGWAHSLGRHQVMRLLGRALGWRVDAVKRALHERQAQRIAELVPDLELVDVVAVRTDHQPG